ncbi:MAG TPA: hypothetical protein VK787_07075, partial [Puia sp.]|nr:hypothetical protein [Puia sp.]
LIFLIIGNIGYFTVPSVANYIIHAGGGNALLYKSTSVFSSAASSTVNTASYVAQKGAYISYEAMKAAGRKVSGYFGKRESSSSGGSKTKEGFMAKKLSGDNDNS